MNSIAKTIIAAGCVLVGFGVLLLFFSHFRIPFLGKLPGDILIEKKNFTFYFPLATSIVISLFVSLIVYIFFRR